ncbi:MAG TPA: hypothetical protein H9733_10175 [Candidatus Anaerotignum merdipullorum]|nr:hypothetical protein [Candidatus Anaerotignum merdipullorum]
MRKQMHIIARCSAFCLLFVLLFGQLTQTLRRDDDETNEIHAFYGEAENSIDVLYIGSSPLLRGVSPMLMYQEHGFTGYSRASALQAPSVSYGLLAESLEYQSPEVVVLVCDNLFQSYDYAQQEGDMRRAMDGMKFSRYKWDIIQEVTAADERQTTLSYLFPLLRYHERWKEFDPAEAEAKPLLEHSFKKGHVYLREISPQAYPEGFMEPSGDTPVFDENALAYTEKSIALCKEQGIEVVLLHLPKMSWTYEKSQAMAEFAKQQGVAYLDFDTAEIRSQVGLDPAVDYYDQGHMNLTGSVKVTRWLGNYLATQYTLPDHRGDAAYAQWEEDLQQYMEISGLAE